MGSRRPGSRPLAGPFGPALISTILLAGILLSCARDRAEVSLAEAPTGSPATPASAPQTAPAKSTSASAPVATAPMSAPAAASAPLVASQPAPASQPASVYDTTLARPIQPRDALEKWALERGADFRLIDRLVDKRTPVPPFDRLPPPPPPPGARISANTPTLPDTNPFPEPAPLFPKEVTICVGIARSTFRTREKEEVLSAAQPFIDLAQRETAVRGASLLTDTADQIYYGLVDGKVQMQISQAFDYLLVQQWFSGVANNGAILLAWAEPAHAHDLPSARALPGIRGTSVELVVARDAQYQAPADLKGARLALTANYVNAPGAFLTRTLMDLQHPLDQPFFGKVTLRRYPKDTILDVLKGKADVACVDEGTMDALNRFYGLDQRVRTLAVSPRYNVDVLYTSQNNAETHRTEIELTQRQFITLQRDPEGQEVLFFYDIAGWHVYRDDDLAVAREHFGDFVKFIQETPLDLKPLLDPHAPVDRETYDRLGDE
jgi:ABC-type phosphate/phosphonate transport system substrate-binding protein